MGGEENLIVRIDNGSVFCDDNSCNSNCGLYLAIGNFILTLNSKSGEVTGISGDINSVKNIEQNATTLPTEFIDGNVIINSDKGLLNGLNYAYNLPQIFNYDYASNILVLGKNTCGDITIRTHKNMYITIADGQIIAVIIDAKITK